MANLQYYDIILKPVITENSMKLVDEKKYTFYVHPEANKIQIREAVEKMFEGVQVDSVHTLTVRGKEKGRGGKKGKTAKRKKAIVALKATSKDIEIFQGV